MNIEPINLDPRFYAPYVFERLTEYNSEPLTRFAVLIIYKGSENIFFEALGVFHDEVVAFCYLNKLKNNDPELQGKIVSLGSE